MTVSRPWFLRLATGASLWFATGCTWHDARGTHRWFVGLGLGVISTTNAPGVNVHQCSGIGLLVGPDAGGLGLFQTHRVVLDPRVASNTVVSSCATPTSITLTHFDPAWSPQLSVEPTAPPSPVTP